MNATKQFGTVGRRQFLAGGAAFGAAALLFSPLRGLASATEADAASARQALRQGMRMEHRRLGSLEVSAIGLGCLPMVGYYGGSFAKGHDRPDPAGF